MINQPAVGENPQNHVTSMFPVPLNPHPDLEGISFGFKGVTFARIDQEEQNMLFSGRSESVSSAGHVIQSVLEVLMKLLRSF